MPKLYLGKTFKKSDNRIPCDTCKGKMTDHKWVMLDKYGYSVSCSNQRKGNSNGQSQGA